MILYHGSDKIIKKPIYAYGKDTNDYGKGFYMTKDLELAKEWAARESIDKAYVNMYEMDLSKFSLLDLDKVDNKVLRWIALLVKYRAINLKNPIGIKGRDLLIKKYLLDVDAYDLIRGYRADDCYFMFARSFLNNEISVEQLGRALVLGKLGDQYVLKSKKAFHSIKFVKYFEIDSKLYYEKRLFRNKTAADEYDIVINSVKRDEHYLSDILKDYED